MPKESNERERISASVKSLRSNAQAILHDPKTIRLLEFVLSEETRRFGSTLAINELQAQWETALKQSRSVKTTQEAAALVNQAIAFKLAVESVAKFVLPLLMESGSYTDIHRLLWSVGVTGKTSMGRE